MAVMCMLEALEGSLFVNPLLVTNVTQTKAGRTFVCFSDGKTIEVRGETANVARNISRGLNQVDGLIGLDKARV